MMTRNENLKTYSIKEIPHYHIYGRTDETQNLLPLFWNGSGIEVNVTGSELWIDLDVDCSFHEPWIATELNGAFMSRQMLLPGSYSICLFRSMTFGVPKTMKFFRELQAMSEDDDCHVFVRGFRCDGEFLPVKEHKYKQVHLISPPSLFRKPVKPSSSTRIRTEASWKKTGNALKMPYTASLRCFVRTIPEHTMKGPTACTAMI